jgi:hypothetical protein
MNANFRVVAAEKIGAVNMANQYADGNPPGIGCPWLKTGNMFVSMVPATETMWVYPVMYSYFNLKKKHIVLITGLHGDYPNTWKKSTKTFDSKRVEDAMFDADQKLAAALEAKVDDINIEIEDARDKLVGLNDWIMKTSTKALKEGKTVVIAWCFGIFTFQLTETAQNKSPQPGMPIYKEMGAAAEKTVNELSLDFDWAITASVVKKKKKKIDE